MNPVIAELAAPLLTEKPHALKKWRLRGKVPTKYWFPLLQAAEAAGKALAVNDFEWKRARPKKRRAA